MAPKLPKNLSTLLSWFLFWTSASIAQPTEKSADWRVFDIPPVEQEQMLKEVNASGGQLLLKLEFTPYRSEGKLKGCGYAYQVLLRDWAYRSNQLTLAYGSVVYFFYPDRPPFLSQRIGLTDIEQRGAQLWQRNTSVNYAYLRWDDKSTAGKKTVIVDGEDGAKSFTYVDPQFELIEWLVLPDPIKIAFNRTPGGTDLEFEVPVANSDVWLSLGSCLREFAGR